MHIANKIVFSTDVIVVGIVLGPKAATLYGLPAKLFQLAFGLCSVGSNLMFPAFAEHEGSATPNASGGSSSSVSAAASQRRS